MHSNANSICRERKGNQYNNMPLPYPCYTWGDVLIGQLTSGTLFHYQDYSKRSVLLYVLPLLLDWTLSVLPSVLVWLKCLINHYISSKTCGLLLWITVHVGLDQPANLHILIWELPYLLFYKIRFHWLATKEISD